MSDHTSLPSFPPLLTGQPVTGSIDPFDKAQALALLGCDSGTVVYNLTVNRLRAAIVFAPEVPLEQAMAAFCTCGIGFQNALGALAPPEVAVHLTWQGGILVNGAACGRLRVAASTTDPMTHPDWLVVGLEVPLMSTLGDRPGIQPDRTSLFDEGCADVDATRLLESWTRHTLVWINSLAQGGNRALHETWRGLAHGIGDDMTLDWQGAEISGTFLGVDEQFGMLLRQGETTRLLPLTGLLENG